MNPFMIEDEDDDEETTQNSMSDEVEVELYGQNKAEPSSAKQSRSSYDMRPIGQMELEKSPLRAADDRNERLPGSCLFKMFIQVGSCLCLPCNALRRWMILYREVPDEKGEGLEALAR